VGIARLSKVCFLAHNRKSPPPPLSTVPHHRRTGTGKETCRSCHSQERSPTKRRTGHFVSPFNYLCPAITSSIPHHLARVRQSSRHPRRRLILAGILSCHERRRRSPALMQNRRVGTFRVGPTAENHFPSRNPKSVSPWDAESPLLRRVFAGALSFDRVGPGGTPRTPFAPTSRVIYSPPPNRRLQAFDPKPNLFRSDLLLIVSMSFFLFFPHRDAPSGAIAAKTNPPALPVEHFHSIRTPRFRKAGKKVAAAHQ